MSILPRKVTGFLAAILIAVLVMGFYALAKIFLPRSVGEREQIFKVAAGTTSKQIARNLEEQDLISSPFIFELYLYFTGSGSKLKAGEYSFSGKVSLAEVADKLQRGETISQAVNFTVIEGWSLREIADAFAKAGLGKKDDFLSLSPRVFQVEFSFLESEKSLEGYLFPDTYRLSKTENAEGTARLMLKNFDKKITKDLRLEIKRKGKSLHEILTLASIIEREVGRNYEAWRILPPGELEKLREERRIVGGIFYNRLKLKMPLESDATITYLTDRRGARATLEELEIDSPYNTYKYQGLPPGPIASPSLDSVLAAVYPAETDYLFFLTSPDGTAHFAKTFAEHISNRKKYLND